MKKVILLFFCFAMLQMTYAVNYYIAASGDDAADGKSINTPFRSIDRINQETLQPGDSVLFKRGDQFRGMLQIKQSGSAAAAIYIGAYGSGSAPVISGAEVLTGWATVSGNVYEAICPFCPDTLQQIFVNNERHIPARYPNAGYLSMTNVDNTAKIYTATSLQDAAGTWTGAVVKVRTMQWVIDAFHVSSYVPQQITYTIPAHFYTSYPIQNYFGFFLTNKLAALDSIGEWFYDPATNQISMIPVYPSALTTDGAEVSVYDNNIRFASGTKYITVENIQLEKSRKDAVFINQTGNITIQNCRILQSGRDGIGGFENYNTYNTALTVQDCLIRDICNTGINLTGGQNILLKGNTIQLTGLIPGLGQGYDAGYEGIFCPPKCNVISNRLDSIGYNAIHINQHDTAMYNHCSNYGLTKNDCGGIYYWSGARNYVAYNIVHDGYGNAEGTVFPDKLMVTGIYSDDYSHDNVVEHNTTYRNETGIMVHNTASTEIKNNVAYDNRRAQLFMTEGSPHIEPAAIHDNVISGNVFQCLDPFQRALLIETEKNNVATFGVFSDNWYCNPYAEEIISVEYTPLYPTSNTTRRYRSLTLSQWQAAYITDAGSHIAFDYPSVYATYVPSGNNLIQNSTFATGTGWWWTYGNSLFTLVAAAAGPQINSASLNGQYQNKQLLSEGNWGIAFIPLVKDKQYLLRYTMAGEQTGGVKIGMNFQDPPSTPITTPVAINRTVSAKVHTDSILFAANYTRSSSLIFKSTSMDGNFWLDDVTLYETETDTIMAQPHTTSKLFVNASPLPVTLPTAAAYKNLNGTIITTDITLQPYTSVVLKDLAAVSTPVKKKTKAQLNLQLFPNPVSNQLSLRLETTSIPATLKIFNVTGEELYQASYDGNAIQIPAEWVNGLYLLQFSNDEYETTARFILQR
jgi:parallel beta-helix repeat protein